MCIEVLCVWMYCIVMVVFCVCCVGGVVQCSAVFVGMLCVC